jgi:hypothetical protein
MGIFLAGMRPLPLWARALLALDRYARRGFRGYEVLRDELLLGRLDPELYEELTRRAYASERAAYLPGGARFEAGLFDWEAMVLDRIGLPPGARVLLGAAGGGRELSVLLDRGYDVVAFEPNETLLSGARAVSAKAGSGQVLCASLEHLVESALQGTGPLASVAGPFDMVLLGWVSLSHLAQPAAHVAVLRAVRTRFPRALVVTSFLVQGEGPTDDRRPVARAARIVLRAVGGRRSSPKLGYLPRAGVIYRFTREEICRIASESEYTVRHMDTSRDGYAILEPSSAVSSRGSDRTVTGPPSEIGRPPQSSDA